MCSTAMVVLHVSEDLFEKWLSNDVHLAVLAYTQVNGKIQGWWGRERGWMPRLLFDRECPLRVHWCSSWTKTSKGIGIPWAVFIVFSLYTCAVVSEPTSRGVRYIHKSTDSHSWVDRKLEHERPGGKTWWFSRRRQVLLFHHGRFSA